MSALLPNIICSAIMSITGLICVNSICGAREKLISFKTLVLMTFLIFLTIYLHNNNYNYIYSIIILVMTIVTYKEVLNISMITSIISCGFDHILIILLEFVGSLLLVPFLTADVIRHVPYINIAINIVFSFVSILIFYKSKISQVLPNFIHKIENKNKTRVIIFIVLSIIAMNIVLYSISQNYKINDIFTKNFLISIILFLLILILFTERNDYEKLSNEYDNLFKYIQIFEDWIEKEQLTRHEYKNQLAVLRSMTKEKKTKDKIDSIVEDFINIDNDMVTQLKSMPNGGLKGLLYYKISVAKKNKINISIDVDEASGRFLSKISGDKQKTLTKLLGIYMDNAIEAAIDTKKKNVSIEIYRIKDEVRIVISNTYNNSTIISNRNSKGVSTKGKGRGNGLYFASKLMSMNNWIEEKQEIIDGYYIQSLIIKK